MAYILRPNGDRVDIKPANGLTFTLEELQKAVGGYIEIVHSVDGQLMIVDEDGRLRNKSINISASAICLEGPIVGDVVICTNKEIAEEDDNDMGGFEAIEIEEDEWHQNPEPN